MHLTDEQLDYFITNVLKPDPDKMTDYRTQVENLEKKVTEKINSDSSFGVIKHLRSGSLKKGTILRKRGDLPIDVDIAFFLRDNEASDYDISKLHRMIQDILISIYPSKTRQDFPIQPRTNHVIFHGTGLEIDIVPILPEDDTCDYGLQPSSQGDNPTRTSVMRQIEFIREYKRADTRFTSLVRMAKYWKREKELNISSYAVELIMCFVQNTEGVAVNLEDGVLRFFLYLYRARLEEPITFTSVDTSSLNEPVIILDPPCSENNVTRWMTEKDRSEIVMAANVAWETLTYGRRVGTKGETTELWKEVFGRSFKIED